MVSFDKDSIGIESRGCVNMYLIDFVGDVVVCKRVGDLYVGLLEGDGLILEGITSISRFKGDFDSMFYIIT
jgi:hypothetical protein